MREFQGKSLVEQAADHLKEAILSGHLNGRLSGAKRIAEEMGISHLTLRAALKLLEEQGYIANHGLGKRRTTAIPGDRTRRILKIGFLKHDPCQHLDRSCLEAVHHLRERGHSVHFADKSQDELGMDVRRISAYVRKIEADAWIVGSAKRNTLKWFSGYELPAYGLFGQGAGIDIAGFVIDRGRAYSEAAERMIRLGHRKLVIIGAGGSRPAGPLESEKSFLGTLEKHGIPTSSYNLPEWENTREGYQDLLERLFSHTPPTAMIFEESIHYYAAEQFCARRGLFVPDEVSMVCADLTPTLFFSNPPITHHGDYIHKASRHVCRWADRVASGIHDRRMMKMEAVLIEGGTIGPVPKTVAAKA